jgi:hypothetical protein
MLRAHLYAELGGVDSEFGAVVVAAGYSLGLGRERVIRLAGPARHVALGFRFVPGQDFEVVATEQPDQRAAAAVIPGFRRDDHDLEVLELVRVNPLVCVHGSGSRAAAGRRRLCAVGEFGWRATLPRRGGRSPGQTSFGVDGAYVIAGHGGELALATFGGGCAAPAGDGLRRGWVGYGCLFPDVAAGGRRLPVIRTVSAILALDNDRAGTRELVAQLLHRSPDPVKCPSGHHGQGRNLIGPANLGTVLLKHAPQHQGVPERGAADRPGHIHNPRS